MVNKQRGKPKAIFYCLFQKLFEIFVQASIEKKVVRERLGGLGGGVAVGANTWLCIVVDGLSKVEGSYMLIGFYNLLRSKRKAFASDQTA